MCWQKTVNFAFVCVGRAVVCLVVAAVVGACSCCRCWLLLLLVAVVAGCWLLLLSVIGLAHIFHFVAEKSEFQCLHRGWPQSPQLRVKCATRCLWQLLMLIALGASFQIDCEYFQNCNSTILRSVATNCTLQVSIIKVNK